MVCYATWVWSVISLSVSHRSMGMARRMTSSPMGMARILTKRPMGMARIACYPSMGVARIAYKTK